MPSPTMASLTRRYVELDAIDDLVKNLDQEFGMFDVVSRDEFLTADEQGTVDDLSKLLWPEEAGTFGESEDFKLAQAESCALVARTCVWLLSVDGRAALEEIAVRFTRIGEEHVRAVREAREASGDA